MSDAFTMVEIVGIKDDERGRSCVNHNVCGDILSVGMLVKINKVEIINEYKKQETAMAINVIVDNIETCRVGFLSRIMFEVYQFLDGKIARIVSIYSDADDIKLCRKMHMNKGVALAKVYLTDEAFKEDEEERVENE